MAWAKKDFCTGLATVPGNFQIVFGNTHVVSLSPDVPVPLDAQLKVFRQRIDDGYANTMQAAGYLVRIIIKFPTGMKHCHDDFCGRDPLFFMHVHRYSTTIVLYTQGVICMNGDLDGVTMPCQSLIDGIINRFEDHVMETRAVVCIPDVHSWSFSDGIQAFQHLDVGRIVICFAHGFFKPPVGLVAI